GLWRRPTTPSTAMMPTRMKLRRARTAAVLRAVAPRADLPRGAERIGSGGRRRRQRHAHPRTAARVAGVRPPYRSCPHRRGHAAPDRTTPRLHLRADILRRSGFGRDGFAWARARPDPD